MSYIDIKQIQTSSGPHDRYSTQIWDEPSHFASNPMIPSDSTVIQRKGELFAWDFEQNKL